MGQRPKRLLAQFRETIQLKHYSSWTGETYLCWIKRFILTHVLNRSGLAVCRPLD